MLRIDLLPEEKQLLSQIDFDSYDPETIRKSCESAGRLAELLFERKAIPESRKRYLQDPNCNIGSTKKSRFQVFESYGTHRKDILYHPHFLKYLKYCIYGPQLPDVIIQGFLDIIERERPITSGTIEMLWEYAREETKNRGLDSSKAAEEFFKLSLECGISPEGAKSIRKIVMAVR